MKFNALANNFSAGEWSEKLVARSDAQEFKNACLKMENFIPKISGGAFKRNGTRRLSFSPSAQSRLDSYISAYTTLLPNVKQMVKTIPFILSNGERKVVVIGNGLANDIPHDGIFIFDADTGAIDNVSATGAGLYNFVSTPEDIQYVQLGDTLVFTFRYGSTPAVLYKSGGSFLAKTFDRFAFDVLGIRTHEAFPFRPIVALGSGGPNLTTSGTSGTITVTSSSAFFDATHIGAVFKFNSSGSTGSARVTAFGSSTSVTMEVISTLPLAGTYGTAATTSWEESAWSDFRGWPSTVTAYQGRLIFGGNADTPNRIWGSRIGNFFLFMERPFEQSPSFSGYLQDNSRPFALEPAEAFASRIVALSSRDVLYIFTDRSEIVGRATQGAFGPLDFSFEVAGSFGSLRVQPKAVGNSVVYVSNIGNKVKEIIYDDSTRQFRVNDLTFTSDDLFTPNDVFRSIFDLCPSNFNDVSSLWVFGYAASGSVVRILNSDKQYKQNAWWRFTTEGTVVSSVYLPSIEGLSPKQFVLVARGSILNIEEVDFEDFDIFPKTGRRYFLDSSLTLGATYAAPNFTITGLAHLDGRTVSVVQENQGKLVASGLTVAGGSITFPNTNVVSPGSGLNFVVGLPYSAVVTTYPIEIGNQVPGTSQGRIKKVDEMVIKLYRTIRLKYGKTEADAVNTVDLDLTNPLNSPPTLFTGSYVAYLDQGYDRQFSVTMVSDEPYPCNILAIIPRGVTYD